jgi:hypothetical protein
MKIYIVIIAVCILLFLSYASVFSDFSNPENVVKYFYDSMAAREWFLTYQVVEYAGFSPEAMIRDSAQYRLADIRRYYVDVKQKASDTAVVVAGVVYRDRREAKHQFHLVKKGNRWFISSLQFEL